MLLQELGTCTDVSILQIAVDTNIDQSSTYFGVLQVFAEMIQSNSSSPPRYKSNVMLCKSHTVGYVLSLLNQNC